MDLFSYPRTPGHRGRDTSIEAAEKVANVSELHQLIFCLLEAQPMTDYEAAEALKGHGYEFRQVQPRRSELAAQGRIVDTGVRRKTPYGRNAIVWGVKPEGQSEPQPTPHH